MACQQVFYFTTKREDFIDQASRLAPTRTQTPKQNNSFSCVIVTPVGDGLPANILRWPATESFKMACHRIFQSDRMAMFKKREDFIFLRKQACTYKNPNTKTPKQNKTTHSAA
ncbi:hypothetical protein ORJ66_01015 [Pseudoalteromonas tunicata]|uniref:hypothetical protein n=1 Tax=Pseudoalteromonas tunicata TaxID=314281 RepID=UPI00273F17D3|nr:hypothetical protein [Pseudoalteromonas tunicata]MDP5211624.1 hypothetical protein [Pseudoalteromonas tunicata]